MSHGPGVFTISLDTELAWGLFDTGEYREYLESFAATPALIDDILTLFERYDIAATWALVAHLLTDCRGDTHNPHPASCASGERPLPCQTGLSDQYWLAPDLVDTLASIHPAQEIGLHGYSHRQLGEESCDPATAAAEVGQGAEVLRAAGTDPESFVFPRNDIGNLPALEAEGFEAYREVDARWFEQEPLPAPLTRVARFADEYLERPPPVVTPYERAGLVAIPGSQIFRPDHGAWGYTPDGAQRRRAITGLNRAAETGGIFHLWFHPFNLGRDPTPLLGHVEAILEHAADLRDTDDLVVWPMRRIARAYREGRWTQRPVVI